jgi:hypothetical protein
MLLKKKVHFFSRLHSAANLSKSNNSPIGNPHPANIHSCIQCDVLWNGSASKAVISPATAANSFSQIHFNISSPAWTPMACGTVCVAYAVAFSEERDEKALRYPLRMKRMSLGRNVTF